VGFRPDTQASFGMFSFFRHFSSAKCKFYMRWNHRRLNQYYTGGESLEDWKIKISVLWMYVTFAAVITSLLYLMEPGVLAGIMAGEVLGMQISHEILLIAAIERLGPLIMAFLSLTLKDSINRWANIILGIVYTVLSIVSMIGYSPQMMLMWGSAAVATALIVWYAWKSKKKA